jgi:hypothetical protein
LIISQVTMRNLIRMSLFVLFLSPALMAQVLVVDELSGPGADYSAIYEAVAAASEGDTILVRQGSYSPFSIDGLSLTVTADRGATVSIGGDVAVRNLGSNQSALLRGLRILPLTQGPLSIEDNQGSVWIEDCSVDLPYLTQQPEPGVDVSNTAHASFNRCVFIGSRAATALDAGAGIRAVNSNVYVFDSTLTGGVGAALLGEYSQPGAGALVEGGLFYASGCMLLGGDGGFGDSLFGCTDGGNGAVGLQLDGNGTARLLDTSVEGGAAGLTGGVCQPGVAGAPQLVLSGSVEVDPFAARSLTVANPLRSGETLVADFRGQPGDRVILSLSMSQSPFYFPGNGQRLIGGPLLPDITSDVIFRLGFLDASGQLRLTSPVPPFVGAVNFYSQAVMFSASPSGEIVFSSAQAVTFLGPGY